MAKVISYLPWASPFAVSPANTLRSKIKPSGPPLKRRRQRVPEVPRRGETLDGPINVKNLFIMPLLIKWTPNAKLFTTLYVET